MWSSQAGSKAFQKITWPARERLFNAKGPTTDVNQTGMVLSVGAGSVAFDPTSRIAYYKIASAAGRLLYGQFYAPGITCQLVDFGDQAPSDITALERVNVRTGQSTDVTTLALTIERRGIFLTYTFNGQPEPAMTSLSGFFFFDT